MTEHDPDHPSFADELHRIFDRGIRQLRRAVVALVGVTVILVGIAMMVLPGPAMVVIPTGLAILAIEFVWARRLLRRFRDGAQWAYDTARGRPHPQAEKPALDEPTDEGAADEKR